MTHTVQYANQRSFIVEEVHTTQMLKRDFMKNTWKVNYRTGDTILDAD